MATPMRAFVVAFINENEGLLFLDPTCETPLFAKDLRKPDRYTLKQCYANAWPEVQINPHVVSKLSEFLQKDNVRYFKLIYHFYGKYFPCMNLNAKRKGMATHPMYFIEGRQIRNFLRDLTSWDQDMLECRSDAYVHAAIMKLFYKERYESL
jgi:hypothetical protein